jgi:hypothetical protein
VSRRIGPALTTCALVAALCGCETTAEKAAQLERTSQHERIVEHGLSIDHASRDVSVVGTAVVSHGEGAAVVVTLHNHSAHALGSVPIAITLKDAQGATVFQNNAPGLEPALTSIASLAAGGEATWVDDQIPATAKPASVTAVVGEAPAVTGRLPSLSVLGVHASGEAGSSGPGIAGTVVNGSTVTQQSLVIYVVARRAGHVVAAARGLLPELDAGARLPFQAFFVGTPSGAQTLASAPPTKLQ